jgi:hypothetical protein
MWYNSNFQEMKRREKMNSIEQNKVLREIMQNLIGDDDISIIEDNPDEGQRCFFCGDNASINFGNVDHDSDCPVLSARRSLEVHYE